MYDGIGNFSFCIYNILIILFKGKQTAGLFTNCDLLAQKITEIGKKCGEPVWRLPIFEEHRLNVESEVADIRNTGKMY